MTKLTNFVEPLEGQDAGYSPDDAHIVFEWDNGRNQGSNPDAPAGLWIMNPDGTGQHKLAIACAEAGCAPRYQPR